VSTGNYIVATYAILSVAGIVTCVVGAMHLLGWELGVSESSRWCSASDNT
jgi:hypothetical protein